MGGEPKVGITGLFLFIPHMNYDQTSFKLHRNWVILGLNDMKASVEDPFNLPTDSSPEVS